MPDISTVILLLSSVGLGIFAGLIPSIGNASVMIMIYPLLIQWPPDVIIAFYAMFLTANLFSSSVAAVSLGIMGDVTSSPMLQERDFLLRHGLVYSVLHHTAMASALASTASLGLLIMMITAPIEISWVLRTETMFLVIAMILIGSLFWRNYFLVNILCLAFGMMLSQVGYNDLTAQTFATFDIPQLAAGIPLQPFLLGIYAVPLLLYSYSTLDRCQLTGDQTSKKWITPKATVWAMLRGTVLGFMVGLIPWIGSIISSNLAHKVEARFNPQQTDDHCVARCASAEAANNAAHISMLLPLLLFGIAISTSETVVLTMLWHNNWTVTQVSYSTLALLLPGVLFSVAVAWIMCTWFATTISTMLRQHYHATLIVALSMIVAAVIYIGYQSDQTFWYLMLLLIFASLGQTLAKFEIDPLPIVVGFLTMPMLNYVIPRLKVLVSFYI